jgi:hypothetical protein
MSSPLLTPVCRGAPLNEADAETFYQGGHLGYPTLNA